MERILIQGVGGVGGLLAAELWRSGRRPTLVTDNPEIATAINRDGITLSTPDDEFHVAAEAYTYLEDLPGDRRFDCAYSAMMAGACVAAARAVLPLLADDGYVVAFQNGFVEDAIGDAIGIERVVSATVALGSTMEAPGTYRRTTPGRLIIGEMDGSATNRIESLRETLQNVITTEISNNIVGVLWGKLLWNGAVSALCAVSGKMLGELFESPAGCALFLISFRESVDTARAQAVAIEPVIVNPDKYYLPTTATAHEREAMLSRLAKFGDKYAGVTPSTLKSLLRGRKSEIDFLNGYILNKAREAGLAAPLNEAVIRMVKEIEAGDRNIGAANLDELLGGLQR